MSKLKLPKPSGLVKDRGYAWLVMVTSCLSQFAHYGFTNSVTGSLTIVQKDYFSINLQMSTLIGSVHLGSMFIFGPPATLLIRRLGMRVCQLVGGTCIILGLGLSSLSSQAWHALILFSVLSGVGVCMCFTASNAILPLHFDRHINLAFSVTAMGSFVGSTVWPVLCQYLLDKYGYSKAMGIMAALHITNIIAGVCYFEPDRIIEKNMNGKASVNDDADANDNSSDKVDQEIKISEGTENGRLEMRIPDDGITAHVSHENEQGKDNLALDVSQTSIHKMSDVEDVEDGETTNKDKRQKLKQDYINLFKSVKVWLFLFSGTAWAAVAVTTYTVLNDYIVTTTDLTAEEAAFGVTLLGMGRLFGCGLLIISSPLKFDRTIAHCVSLALFATMAIALSFSNGKPMYYALATIYGFGNGVTVATMLPVINSFWCSNLQPLLLGLHFLADGTGGLALPPIFVYIGSVAGAKYSLIATGCYGLLGALSLCPLICYNAKRRNHE